MKKNAFLVVLTAILFAFSSCGKKTDFTIHGSIDGELANNCLIFLYDVNGNEPRLLDSALVTDGTFFFSGKADTTKLGMLYSDQIDGFSFPIVIEPGDITFDADSINISGTQLNEALYQHLAATSIFKYREELATLSLGYSTADTKEDALEIEHEFDSINAIISSNTNTAALDLLKSHPEDVLGVYAFIELLEYGKLDYTALDSIRKNTSTFIANSEVINVRMKPLEKADNTSVGKHYTDIEGIIFGTNESGKLSDLIDGKFALVDFWASWCQPCIGEIKENIIRINEKYASRGLVVVGVDVFDDMGRHEFAVNELKIKYPQLIDTTGKAAEVYGVQGIPHIMLIASDGTILARDLRGDSIEAAVARVLK